MDVAQVGNLIPQGLKCVVCRTGVELIKVARVDLGLGQIVDGCQDDLQDTLMDLSATDAMDITPATDFFVIRIVRVPHHCDDGAAAVGKFEQQVFSALTIDANLFIGQPERLVE